MRLSGGCEYGFAVSMIKAEIQRFMTRAAVLAIAPAGWLSPCGFIINADPTVPDPWLTTASGPARRQWAATITWSIVPDGTTVTNNGGVATAPSNLIAFLNSTFGGSSAQHDLTQQPWFPILESTFNRWSELSGVTYLYEPHDDGALHPSLNGQLGVRGDIRLGGINIDGPNGTLAFTYIPSGGSDMVIDTADGTFFSDSSSNYLRFRNTVTHELGHSFGLEHVTSSRILLMEPFINTAFDGPQLDEVRGVQFFFGDANEKSNGVGNNTASYRHEPGTDRQRRKRRRRHVGQYRGTVHQSDGEGFREHLERGRRRLLLFCRVASVAAAGHADAAGRDVRPGLGGQRRDADDVRCVGAQQLGACDFRHEWVEGAGGCRILRRPAGSSR